MAGGGLFKLVITQTFSLLRIPPPAGGGLFKLVITQTFSLLRIPPPAGGGLFKPGLQKDRHFFESHHRQVVDRSSPTYLRRKPGKAGFEQSTTCRWWDSGKHFCRW